MVCVMCARTGGLSVGVAIGCSCGTGGLIEYSREYVLHSVSSAVISCRGVGTEPEISSSMYWDPTPAHTYPPIDLIAHDPWNFTPLIANVTQPNPHDSIPSYHFHLRQYTEDVSPRPRGGSRRQNKKKPPKSDREGKRRKRKRR